MNGDISLQDIRIRTRLQPGDIGYITYRHGRLYHEEYNYGISFEAYVAKGLFEFHHSYDASLDRVWVCEHNEMIVGFLLLMHRDDGAAQLRFFYLEPPYRGIGLGRKLMTLFMEWLKERGYKSAFLWTTSELIAAASLYRRFGFRLTEEKESTAFDKAVKEQKYEMTTDVNPGEPYE